MPHVIGVDVGSQSIKAVCMDDSGAVVRSGSAPLSMHHPQSGWAEQAPGEWTTQLATVIGELVRDQEFDVVALGLACQVDGVVAIDRALRPLYNALIWLDRRAVAETRAFVAEVGEAELFLQTGLNADASHGAPKMMWLRRHAPEVWRDTHYLVPVGAYLLAWLTGRVAQDPANASSTMLYDLRAGEYSDNLCQVAGVPLEMLPPVLAATEVIGTLAADAADVLGLPRGCRVVVGTGDEHAASLAAGVLAPGIVADVAGTAEPVTAASDKFLLDDSRLVETHAHAVAGTFLIENPGFVSGGSTLWFAEQVLRLPQSRIFDLAATAPPGSDGVFFVPALTGSTAPRWNGDLRGSFAGLSMNHSQSHLARAVLEGCAYALRDIVDCLTRMGLADDEVRIVGGGGRSSLWNQIKADVLGRPVRRVLSREGTALGGAMLAAVSAGFFVDLHQAAAAALELADSPVLPNEHRVSDYRGSYEAYRRLFDGLEGALV